MAYATIPPVPFTWPPGEFVHLCDACKLAGRHESTVMRLALNGYVRHRIGCRGRTEFASADLRRLARPDPGRESRP